MAENGAPEWLIEEGIGETRALLIERGEVLGAKLVWRGELIAGSHYPAKLISKASGARRGTAALENGTEVLVDHLPPELTEGADFSLRISRAAIAERGRFKYAQGRYVPENEADLTSSHAVWAAGKVVRQFPAGLWEDVWLAASSASLDFPGGEILVSTTPAMTLIDIDGKADPRELAVAALPTIAQGLSWFDLGGSIGIDFPTLATKADRREIDKALAAALSDWPHERTAINGFGFVQLVARLEGPSLLHRFAASRVGMCARAALRRAERVGGPGALLLTVHPALKAKLKPIWLEELARRTGKQVRIEVDPGLALEAAHAQNILV
ncbi:MAG: ribonuclease [Pseudomonadota bacterium]